MVLDELTRSGCVDNRDVAPESIAVFDALSWATTNGHIKNIEFLMEVPELPNEPEQPTEPEVTEPETTEPEVTEPEVTEPAGLELTFTNGTGGALAVEEGNYDIVRFEYKLESAGELYVVLRDATWLKYFGCQPTSTASSLAVMLFRCICPIITAVHCAGIQKSNLLHLNS